MSNCIAVEDRLMEDDTTPRAAESVPVVLARIDGKLDLLNYRVADLIPRVGKVEDRVKALEDLTLTLSKNAEAEEAKKIASAAALKEADDLRRNQSERSWTPIQRFFAAVGAIGVIVALVIQFYSVVHH
jgi:hypothetical protein